MIEPKKMAYSRLDNKSLATFSRELVALVSQQQDDEFIARQCSKLDELSKEMDLAFSRNVKSPFTKEISDLEKGKREILVAIRAELYSNSKQKFINENRSLSASILYEDFKKVFANSYRIGVKISSAEVNSFITTVNCYDDELKLSGISKMVEILQQHQIQLDTLYKNKIESEKEKRTIRQVRYIRNDIEKRVKAIASYLQINYEDMEEQYSTVFMSFNALIVDFMGRLRSGQDGESNHIENVSASEEFSQEAA